MLVIKVPIKVLEIFKSMFVRHNEIEDCFY